VSTMMKDIKYSWEVVKNLADRKAQLLTAVTVVYVLGYFVWSLNAYRNGLGILPALDLQYFVAGVFPTLVLATLVTFYSMLRNSVISKREVKEILLNNFDEYCCKLLRKEESDDKQSNKEEDEFVREYDFALKAMIILDRRAPRSRV